MRIVVFDDVLHARGERFAIAGLDIEVLAHADDAPQSCAGADLVCMDFAMGKGHLDGAHAIAALRQHGFTGRIVAMSSDPTCNQKMIAAGADESLAKKAMLGAFLTALGKEH